ncbi:hypothetical protein EJ06DRAFT_554974 [Trichodelitschia bisporula]|uniref:Uncharacterized protein n=1 Tax=Trichodelitschia bisporula TaxID=703511 RepID=A0A6G1I2M1_9PEZI|nr:hypothetical protein EJ06DRAFT_554974 [Trichodelitschia bisporula]
MGLIERTPSLQPRQTTTLPSGGSPSQTVYCDFYYGSCSTSSWDNWVRWVVLVVVILTFLLAFCLCSCFTARRRRRMGQRPYYGTRWASQNRWGGGPPGQNPPNGQYGQAAPHYQPPPPQYSAAPPPGHMGFYHHENGVELQQPKNTYNPHPNQAGGPIEFPAGPATQSTGVIR